MRHRMVIRSATTSDDGRGGQTVTWSDIGNVQARVRSLGTREYLQSGAMQNAMAHALETRYQSILTVKQRLYWTARGLLMEIVALDDPDGLGEQLNLECVEVDS